MTDFDLALLDPAIERRREEWVSLGVHWQAASSPSPYSKPSSFASFESDGYAGQLTLWASGEAELEVGRIADGRRLCKTYMFTISTEIDIAVDDLITFIGLNRVPDGAYLWDR
jgi:hypothetical protein